MVIVEGMVIFVVFLLAGLALYLLMRRIL